MSSAVLAVWAAWTVEDQVRVGASSSFVQCERSREFGPPLASYYQRTGALDAKQAQDYLRTIPTHCVRPDGYRSTTAPLPSTISVPASTSALRGILKP